MRSMLHSMQEEIRNPFAHTAPDFAGLLAALAAAKPIELPTWNDEELPQDVATLSYERALRKHARYKSGDAEGLNEAQVPASNPRRSGADAPDVAKPGLRNEESMRQSVATVQTSERDRKCASVTIRMSNAECEQLRQRAAEAGLSISAYLRSCTFEAEVLRTQVKQALAELRTPHSSEGKPFGCQEKQTASATTVESLESPSGKGSRFGWLRRIVPDLHPARSIVRA
jgi:predicted DNA binding CopG/RHH family protein